MDYLIVHLIWGPAFETSTKGTPEYYASLSQSELQREMASMTPDAIDKLLQAMDY